MSFSSDVKQELLGVFGEDRDALFAEFLAVFCMSNGKVTDNRDSESKTLVITTENSFVEKKSFTLYKKIFNIDATLESRATHEGHGTVWVITMTVPAEFPVENCEGFGNYAPSEPESIRAFLRGVFLVSGSVSDPNKSYHLEVVCDTKAKAAVIQEAFRRFDLEAKTVLRKKYYVVYLKESNQIVDALNVCGASLSLMDMENIRILREIKGAVNRKFNCEMANINKTVNAAVTQMDDINLIAETTGLGSLPPGLKEVAELRLERPQASLKELGEALDSPVGKSGVNHRLRKLKAIADRIRSNTGGEL